MPKPYRRTLKTRISDFFGGVAAASQPVESERNRSGKGLRAAWIDADCMVGICKF